MRNFLIIIFSLSLLAPSFALADYQLPVYTANNNGATINGGNTYYFGGGGFLSVSTTFATGYRNPLVVGTAGTINTILYKSFCSALNTASWIATLNVSVNGAGTTTVGTDINWDVADSGAATSSTVSIPVNVGDRILFSVVTPAGTAPCFSAGLTVIPVVTTAGGGTGTTSTSSVTVIDNPAQNLYNGIYLLFACFSFVVWYFLSRFRLS
jgi:hypothetical protein